MENFDGAGQYRTSEGGTAIDTSGSLDGKEFNSPQGLAQALRDHPGVPTCLVKRMHGYGVGGSDHRRSTSHNWNISTNVSRLPAIEVPDLLRAIALSPAFGNVAEPPRRRSRRSRRPVSAAPGSTVE